MGRGLQRRWDGAKLLHYGEVLPLFFRVRVASILSSLSLFDTGLGE